MNEFPRLLTVRVNKWSSLQKEGTIEWFKFYRTFFDDAAIAELSSNDTRMILQALWDICAGKKSDKIQVSLKVLARKAFVPQGPDRAGAWRLKRAVLEHLLELQDVDLIEIVEMPKGRCPAGTCFFDRSSEKQDNGLTKEENQQINEVLAMSQAPPPKEPPPPPENLCEEDKACPDSVEELYNEILGGVGELKKSGFGLLHAGQARDDLMFSLGFLPKKSDWRQLFETVKALPKLLGTDPVFKFRATIVWVVKYDNIQKIRAGTFDGESPPNKSQTDKEFWEDIRRTCGGEKGKNNETG